MDSKKPSHPGRYLAEIIKEFDLSINTIAKGIYISDSAIRQIIKGKRGIGALMALRLGRFFGTPPAFWMDLQQTYEIDQMRRHHATEISQIQPIGDGE